MTMTDTFHCPVAGCDTFPYDTPDELAAHVVAEHVTAAPAPETVRSFSPGGTRATVERYNPMNRQPDPRDELPPCSWKNVDGVWLVRGPMATLAGATTVTVEKRNGERKAVDINPSSVRESPRGRHDRHAMAIARPAPRPTAAAVPEGFHILDDTVFKVQTSAAGNVYAKRLVPSSTGKKGRFEYAPGAVRDLSAATHVADAAAAAAAGRRFGFCIRCGALLTDPSSVERGIGPVCAEKF